MNYTMTIETIDDITADFATCGDCGHKEFVLDAMDGARRMIRHQRNDCVGAS